MVMNGAGEKGERGCIGFANKMGKMRD